jgi:hypothetical protein
MQGMRDVIEDWMRAEAGEDDRKIARRLLAKLDARETHRARPGLAHAFIRLDRVFSPKPVRLFGQPTASLAFNRLSIHASTLDPETGDPVPAEPLFSGLIGEEMLARLVMNQNRGESEACMTGETIMGTTLGPWTERMPDLDTIFESELDDVVGAGAVEAADRVAKGVAGLRKPLDARRASELASTIRHLAQPKTFAFEVERHIENVEKRRVGAQVEMAHSALHIGRIVEARATAGLIEDMSGPSAPDLEAERISNPLLDAFSGTDPEEARIMALAARWKIRRLLLEAGAAPDGYDPSGDSGGVRLKRLLSSGKSDAVDKAGTLCNMANMGENPHVLAREAETAPWRMTASISQVTGSTAGLHTDLMQVGDRSFRLRLETATVDVSMGDLKIRSGREVLEVVLMPGDLMTMLRGHPTGDFTRCTMNRFCGGGVPFLPYENRMSRLLRDVSDLDADVPDLPRAAELKAALGKALDLVGKGLAEKADRDALADLVRDIGHLAEEASDENRAVARETAGRAETMIRRDLEKLMAELETATGLAIGSRRANAIEDFDGPD